MEDHHAELMALAARIWTAAESIDALYGGDRVWRWTHRQVARLEREGKLEDLEALGELTRVLEDRLEMERQDPGRDPGRENVNPYQGGAE